MKKLKKSISYLMAALMIVTLLPLWNFKVHAAAGVQITADPTGSASVNSSVTFQANVSDLDKSIYKNPQYLFWVYPPNGAARQSINTWSSDNKATWKPDKTGVYDIKVYVQPTSSEDTKSYRLIGDLNYEVKEKSDNGGNNTTTGQAFTIENPYSVTKKYPYRLAQHDHTKWTTDYIHVSETSDELLKAYRDYPGTPQYGAVAITEHSRITTPENTTPQGQTNPPWGVDNILWIPGIEQYLGDDNGKYGNIFGEMCAINVSTDTTKDIAKNDEFYKNAANYSWVAYDKDNHTFYTRQLDGKHAYLPYNPREAAVYAQFSFSGTGIAWTANKNSYGGKVDVYIDDSKMDTIDLYSQDTQAGKKVFEKLDLKDGSHTIKLVLEDTDARNGNFNEISVNSFVVTKAGNTSDTVYGSSNDKIVYGPDYYKDNYQHELYAPQDIIKNFKNEGAFTSLNHPKARRTTPEWVDSGWTKEELNVIFGDDKGIGAFPYLPNAMEIGNANYDLSDTTNYTNAEEEWDYILSKGHKVWGVASDDAHSIDNIAKGWSVVYTNAASTKDITKQDMMDSLFSGNYYASQGPCFNDIKVDGSKISITTDKSGTIDFITKNGKVAQSTSNVSNAEYQIKGDEGYVRVKFTREDASWKSIGGGIGQKRSAWTNPIFVTPEYTVAIQGDDSVAVPQSDQSTNQYKAVVKDFGKVVSEDVVWSVKTDNNDNTITVDNSGNLKISSDTKSSSVTLIASLKKDNTVIGSKTITLKKSAINVTSIKLNKTSLDLKVGEESTLSAAVTPDTATNKSIIWSSNKASVADIDSNGKVKAIGAGSAIITATSSDGSKQDICIVTVSNPSNPDTVVNGITSYIVVNTTAIELNYANSNPEVLMDVMNKNPDSRVYIPTQLSDLINYSSMLLKVDKIIDSQNPYGKHVVVAKLNVNYTRVFGTIGTFSVSVDNSMADKALYFTLSTENNQKIVVGHTGKTSVMGENLKVFFFDRSNNLLGSTNVSAYPEEQCVIVDLLK